MPKVLLWLRQDLRLEDNPALNHAFNAGDVLPVYILDDDNAGDWAAGGASRWWLHHSLKSLTDALQGRLHLFTGDARELIPQLCQDNNIDEVVWSRCYEPWRIERDTSIKAILKDRGIKVTSVNSSLLWEPWEVLKADQSPYKVFTPYYRRGCLGGPRPPAQTRQAAKGHELLSYPQAWLLVGSA